MPISDKEVAMAGRLKLFREALNIKQKEICFESETSQGQLSEMESGKKQIQPRVVLYLAERYGLNVDWLYTGRGEMQIGGVGVRENQPPYGSTEHRLRLLEEKVRDIERRNG